MNSISGDWQPASKARVGRCDRPRSVTVRPRSFLRRSSQPTSRKRVSRAAGRAPARCGFLSVQSRQSRASMRRDLTIGSASSPNSLEEAKSPVGEQEVAIAVRGQNPGRKQRVAKGSASPAGQMVVAAARLGHGGGGNRLAQRAGLHRRRDQRQRLKGGRHQRSAEPVVAVPSARPDRDQSARHQALQVTAGGRGAHAGRLRQLPGRPFRPVDQGVQHGAARTVTHQRCH